MPEFPNEGEILDDTKVSRTIENYSSDVLQAASDRKVENRQMTGKHFGKIYTAILCACVVLYILLALENEYIWGDEALSLAMTRLSLGEMKAISGADVHPLGYFIYLKAFLTVFGTGIFAAKISSILPYIYILAFGGWTLRKIFDEKTALMFMVLFFFFPFILHYSIEIRMYSLAAAFVFSNAIFAYRCYAEDKNSNWIFLVISSVGAAYIHYYAFVAIGIIDIILLIEVIQHRKDKIRYWIVSFAAMILLYAPWINQCVQQLFYKADHEFWIEPITIRTIISYAVTVFKVGGFRVLAIPVGAAYLGMLVYVMKQEEQSVKRISVYLLLVPLLTVVIGIAVSIIVRPVFVIRYAVPALPLMIVFMAMALARLRRPMIRRGIFIFFVACGVLNYSSCLVEEYRHIDNEMDAVWVSREACASAEAYVVLHESTHVSTVLGWYENQKPIYIEENQIDPASPFPNVKSLSEYDGVKYKRIMLLLDPDEEIPQENREYTTINYTGRYDETGYQFDAYYCTR